jgi:hypothetical protein
MNIQNYGNNVNSSIKNNILFDKNNISKPIKIIKNIPNNICNKNYLYESSILIESYEINNEKKSFDDESTDDLNEKKQYELKDNIFNPDNQSPQNSWKYRLMERIQIQSESHKILQNRLIV